MVPRLVFTKELGFNFSSNGSGRQVCIMTNDKLEGQRMLDYWEDEEMIESTYCASDSHRTPRGQNVCETPKPVIVKKQVLRRSARN